MLLPDPCLSLFEPFAIRALGDSHSFRLALFSIRALPDPCSSRFSSFLDSRLPDSRALPLLTLHLHFVQSVKSPSFTTDLFRFQDIAHQIRLALITDQARILFALVIVEREGPVVIGVLDQQFDRVGVPFRRLDGIV